MSQGIGRFAPSTTGPAHPGTLLAALLCWLDARSAGAQVLLRLEDLDPERSTPERVAAMRRDLAWIGLDWDGEVQQSRRSAGYESALDQLEERGLLYPCSCSRSQIKALGKAEVDGSTRYPGTCRGRALPATSAGGWRASREPLRVRIDLDLGSRVDESGLELIAVGGRAPGDPVVRRRDGVASYQLATVVDDADSGVTRIVRGRDLATSTPVQIALQRLLEAATPDYRHHLLLLEERGGKLAKLHGAVGIDALRAHYSAQELCGQLAHLGGLIATPEALRPSDLLASFSWDAVASEDRVVRWTGSELESIH